MKQLGHFPALENRWSRFPLEKHEENNVVENEEQFIFHTQAESRTGFPDLPYM